MILFWIYLVRRWLERRDHAVVLDLEAQRLTDEELWVLGRKVRREGRRRGWRGSAYDRDSGEEEEEEEGSDGGYVSDGKTAVEASRSPSPDTTYRADLEW